MNTSIDDNNRNWMWCKILPGYEFASKNKKKKMKAQYCLANRCKPHQVTDCIPVTPIKENNMRYDYNNDNGKVQVEINPRMNIEAAIPTDQKQRSFLDSERRNAYCNLRGKAMSFFGLTDDADPQTPEELVQRIKDGKYTIKPTDENDYYLNPIHLFRWHDPAIVKNKAGYNAWETNVLDPANTVAERTIQIKSPDEGLAALQAFEATTIQ